MSAQERTWAGSRLATLGAGALLALAMLAGSATAQEVGVAARVNGVEIGIFRLERHFEDYLKVQGRNLGAIRNPSVFKRLKREALDQLIDKELLWQEAQRRGIVVDEAAVRAASEAVAKGFRTPEAFARRLREAGFDEAGYDAYLRREIAASRALDALVDGVEVTEAEVRGFYEQNRARFERPDGAAMPEADALVLIRRHLTAARRDELIRTELERLRRDAKVDILLAL